MKAREISLKVFGILGAVIGYGCLAVFLVLVASQVYRWFRDGEWTHIGLGDALSSTLNACCVHSTESLTGRFVAWFDSPDTWIGMHHALVLIPASFALFAVSIFGNALFIFCRDRLRPA